MGNRKVSIIGAGLVGSLTATLLAQRGFGVEVFERRADPRKHDFQGGRSINLALAERGLNALHQAGLANEVLAEAVMMRGRMVHPAGGEANLQRYGLDDSEVIRSVSRGGLNILLLNAAERAGAQLRFDAALADADFEQGRITLADPDGSLRGHEVELLLGCDGAGSALRAAMARTTGLGERVEPLGHGYKELEIPAVSASPAPDKSAIPGTASRPLPGRDDVPMAGITNKRFAMEPHALHIWPRGNYMCIALPNTEGNFTVTLFLPNEGAFASFAALPDADSAHRFFAEQFPGLLALMPTFDEDWNAHPVGQLATLYLDKWHLGDRAVLLGDAAHAVVPFHGQGMNAGFEDAAELAALMAAPGSGEGLFGEFQRRRKPNTDAIAAMSLANYIEMRDGVADPHYLLKRELAAALTAREPRHFMSRYRMVSFTTLPYTFCVEREQAQSRLMESILTGHVGMDDIDLDQAAARVHAELPVLPTSSGP